MEITIKFSESTKFRFPNEKEKEMINQLFPLFWTYQAVILRDYVPKRKRKDFDKDFNDLYGAVIERIFKIINKEEDK